MKKTPKATAVAEYTLKEIETRVNETDNKHLSDSELMVLHSVFGATLQRALDILEKYTTLDAYTTSDKTRVLIEIKGDNDRCYRVFPRINFCPCQSFKRQVIEKKVQITCKHILAARIAIILDKTVPHEVTKEQYSMLLGSVFELEN